MQYIKYEIGQIASITLNRPEKHNALNLPFIVELLDVIEKIATNVNIRAVIIQAVGKNFCTGADLSWMQAAINLSVNENKAEMKKFASLLKAISFLKIPTIAYVHGKVLGGGLGILAACDMVIAAEHTIFAAPEIKLGLVPAIIAPYLAKILNGRSLTQLLLGTVTWSASEALQAGLISNIIRENEFKTHQANFVSNIIKSNNNATLITKELLKNINGIGATDNDLADIIATARISSEGQHGLKCFLAKKELLWQQICDNKNNKRPDKA